MPRNRKVDRAGQTDRPLDPDGAIDVERLEPRIKPWTAYIAAMPEATAITSVVVVFSPPLKAASPLTPKSAMAATTVRNDSTPKNQSAAP